MLPRETGIDLTHSLTHSLIPTLSLALTHPLTHSLTHSLTQVPEAVELFGARFKMHNNVYQHKCVKQLEYMITDVLMKADPYMQIMGTKNNEYPDGRYRISQCIDDMCAFSKLKDSIIDIISHDPNPLLEPAKELDSLSYILTHSLTHLLTHLLTYSFTHLLTHWLTYSLTHLLTQVDTQNR